MDEHRCGHFRCPSCGGSYWSVYDHTDLELIRCKGCRMKTTRDEAMPVHDWHDAGDDYRWCKNCGTLEYVETGERQTITR